MALFHRLTFHAALSSLFNNACVKELAEAASALLSVLASGPGVALRCYLLALARCRSEL